MRTRLIALLLLSVLAVLPCCRAHNEAVVEQNPNEGGQDINQTVQQQQDALMRQLGHIQDQGAPAGPGGR